MKKLLTILLMFCSTFIFAQEQIGLPGDNLNLYAVLSLFQKSATLEQFERELNNPDNKINNLDLNGDGQTDYIQVTDHVISTTHMISLQVNVSQTEKQDIAVIEVGKTDGQVRIQIIGDEELYGKDYIVEPQASTPNPAYTDDIGSSNVSVSNDVATWAIINWMYVPTYSVYVSPYYYGYYPYYWHPWRPVYYNEYYGWHSHYYGNPYYRRNNYYYYHGLYAPHRNVSPYVHRTYFNNYHPVYHQPQHFNQPAPQHNQPQHFNAPHYQQPQHNQPQHNQPQHFQPQQHQQPQRQQPQQQQHQPSRGVQIKR